MFFNHVAALLYRAYSFITHLIQLLNDGDGIFLRDKMHFLVKIDMLHLIVVAFDIKIDRK